MSSPEKVELIPFSAAILINREIEFGEVYLVDDRLISIPDADRVRSGRTYHETRRVVIIQNNELNYTTFPLVQIAPLAHFTGHNKRRFDILLEPNEEQGTIETASIVHLTLSQPMLRIDLGDRLGTLSRKKSAEITAALLEMLDHSCQ